MKKLNVLWMGLVLAFSFPAARAHSGNNRHPAFNPIVFRTCQRSRLAIDRGLLS